MRPAPAARGIVAERCTQKKKCANAKELQLPRRRRARNPAGGFIAHAWHRSEGMRAPRAPLSAGTHGRGHAAQQHSKSDNGEQRQCARSWSDVRGSLLLAVEPGARAPGCADPLPTTKNTTIDRPPGIGVPFGVHKLHGERVLPGLQSDKGATSSLTYRPDRVHRAATQNSALRRQRQGSPARNSHPRSSC